MKNDEVYDFINAFMGTSLGHAVTGDSTYGAGNSKKGNKVGWVKVRGEENVYEFRGTGDKNKSDIILSHGNAEHQFTKGDRVKVEATKSGGLKVTRAGETAEAQRQSTRERRQAKKTERTRESQRVAKQSAARSASWDTTGAVGRAQQRLNRLQSVQPRNKTAQENLRKEIARTQSDIQSATRRAVSRRGLRGSSSSR